MRKKSKSGGPSATSGGDATSNSSNSVNRPFVSPLLSAATPSSDSFGLFGSGSSPPGFGSFIGSGLYGSDTLAHTRPFSSIRSSGSPGISDSSKASFGSRPFTAPPLSDSDASDSEASEKASGYGKSFGTFGLGKASFGSRPFTVPPLSESDASDPETSEKASGISGFGKFGKFDTSGSRRFTAPLLFESDASDSEASEKASGYGKSFGTRRFTAPLLSDSDTSDSEASGFNTLSVKLSNKPQKKRVFPITKGPLTVTKEDVNKLNEDDLGWLENSFTRAFANKAKGIYVKRFAEIYEKVHDVPPPKTETSEFNASSDTSEECKYPIVKGPLTVTEEDAKKLDEEDIEWLKKPYSKAISVKADGLYTAKFTEIYRKVNDKDPPSLPKASDAYGYSLEEGKYPITKGPLTVTMQDTDRLNEKDIEWLENSHTRAVATCADGEKKYAKKFVVIYRKLKGKMPPELINSTDTSGDSFEKLLGNGKLPYGAGTFDSNVSVESASDSDVYGDIVRKKRDYPIKKHSLTVTEDNARKLTEEDLDWLEHKKTRAVASKAEGKYCKPFVAIYNKLNGEDPPDLFNDIDTNGYLFEKSLDFGDHQSFDDHLKQLLEMAIRDSSAGDENKRTARYLAQMISNQYNMLQLNANARQKIASSKSHKREQTKDDGFSGDEDDGTSGDEDDGKSGKVVDIRIQVKVFYVYIIAEKSREPGARGRKSVVYWGVTMNPSDRWGNHKSHKGFTDATHEFLVVYKVTAETRLYPEHSLLTNAIVCEYIIDTFSKHFSRCKKFKPGNGQLQDPVIRECLSTVSDAQKAKVLDRIDYVLARQKHMQEVEPFKCDYCGKDYLSTYNLTEHLNSMHSDVIGAAKKKYICKKCPGKTFGSANEYSNHNKYVHNRAKDCPVCGKHISVAKQKLKAHLVEDHKYSKLEAKFAAGCKLSKQDVKDLQCEREEKARSVKKTPIKAPTKAKRKR